ncbi:PHD [Seminavis robusta]|uniref:PHD n=1 Tax=Seminavis robusta TaxID=568900 RepID=A0A9N8E427_9STRA|nr:PHD [Seminavis robusta]|eukprot:Sro627_g177860.1 PHD (2328) ;mRNA; r:8364-15620
MADSDQADEVASPEDEADSVGPGEGSAAPSEDGEKGIEKNYESEDDNISADGDDGGGDESDSSSSSGSEDDEDDAVPEIERRRRENIKRNEAVLAQLGLQSKDEGGVLGKKQTSHRKRRRTSVGSDAANAEPKRRSKRSTGAVSYAEQPLRTLLEGDNPSKPKPEKREDGPKKRRAKRQPKESTRMARFVYDEFQAISTHKRRVFKDGEKNLRFAETECRFWQKKAAIEEKKDQKFVEAERQRKEMEEERQIFGTSGKEFLQELDRRAPEISGKIRLYDGVRGSHETRVEIEARRLESENKFKILEARCAYPKAVKETIRRLNACLLERAPKDPPPPRRSKRVSEDAPPELQPKKQKGGSNTGASTEKDSLSSESAVAISNATAQALLSQTESDLASKSFEGNQQPGASDNGKTKQKKENKLNVGQWISPSFCETLNRAWLEKDAASKRFDLSAYVPQPGDTVLYYPAGHREFVKEFPDYLGKKLISRAPLWERAEKEQRKSKKAADGKENDNEPSAKSTTNSSKRWWNDEWIEGVDPTNGKLGHYPILCRVDKTQAEFPPDPTNMVADKGSNTWTETTAQPKTKAKKNAKKHAFLRLAVTLRPLTPVLPPSWTDNGPTDKESLPTPSVTFTVVTFPAPSLSPFIVPFAWTYIRNHFLTINDTVSVQSTKEEEQKGKIAGFDTLDGDYGSFRVEDKSHVFTEIMQRRGTDNVAASNGGKTKGRLGPTLPPHDTVVIGQFLANLLKLSNVGQVADLAHNIDFVNLIRSTFPLWNGVSLQASVYDRRTSWAHPWDVKTTGSKRNQSLAQGSLKEFLNLGLPVTLDNVLRMKIECTIEDKLKANGEPDSAEWFKDQVTEDIAPAYGCAVPITVSFSRILTRLKQQKQNGTSEEDSKCYYRSFEAVMADITAIQDNCSLYNTPDSVVVQAANEVVPAVKKLLSSVLDGHLKEQREKLHAENEKRKFLASVVASNAGADQEKEKAQNKPLDPFMFPYKGPLYRDWLQATTPDVSCQSGRGCFSQWVPQTGDTVLYARELHLKFVQAHYDSLVANQRQIPPSASNGDQAPGIQSETERKLNEPSEWVAATIVSVQYEFPNKPPKDAEGCFDTEAALLAIGLRFPDANGTAIVYWRPCMFLCKNDGGEANTSGTCKFCGVRYSTSFLCPSWCDHFGKQLADILPFRASRPSGMKDDEKYTIGRSFDLLKLRCVDNAPFLDPDLTTERIKQGFMPRVFKACHKPIPTFETAFVAESSGNLNEGVIDVKGVSNKSVSTLLESNFLPPWMVLKAEEPGTKKTAIGSLEASVSPCPKLSLELISLRIRNGCYRQKEAIESDILEAYTTSILCVLAHPAKRKKNPISIKKICTVLSSRKHDERGNTKNGGKGSKTNAATQNIAQKEKSPKKAASSQKTNGQKGKNPKKANDVQTASNETEEKQPKPNGRKVLTDEESELLERCGKIRLLYATALVCVSEVTHVSHLVGLKNLKVSRQQLRSEMIISSRHHVEAAKARKDLLGLLDAIKRDICDNRYPLLPQHRPKVNVKFLVAGKPVEREKTPVVPVPYVPVAVSSATAKEDTKPAAAEPSVPTPSTSEKPQPASSSTAVVKSVAAEAPISSGLENGTKGKVSRSSAAPALARDSVTFEIGDFENDSALSRLCFGRENRNNPCARCSLARKSFVSCRVIKAHSNVDFDLAACLRDAGGLDALLRTLLHEPPPPGSAAVHLFATTGATSTNTTQENHIGGVAEKPADETTSLSKANTSSESQEASSGPKSEPTKSASEHEGAEAKQEPTKSAATGDHVPENKEGEKNDADSSVPAQEQSVAKDVSTAIQKETTKPEDEVVKDVKDRFFNRKKYQEAQALQAEAKQILTSATLYRDAPARLSDVFMDENFPVDPSDGKYAFCVVCGLDGGMICCDTEGCPTVVHVKCTTMTEVPEGDWFCDKCIGKRSGDSIGEVDDSLRSGTNKSGQFDSKAEVSGHSKPDVLSQDSREIVPSEAKTSDSEASAPLVQSSCHAPANPAFVMPPLVPFDDAKATKLAARLDQLFYLRTGHHRKSRSEEVSEAKSNAKAEVNPESKDEATEKKPEAKEEAKEKEEPSKEVEQETRAEDGIIPVGTVFEKKFRGHGTFEGRVIQLPTEDHQYYRVKYSDDDEEDLTPNQLLRLLQSKSKKPSSKQKTVAKSGGEDKKKRGRPRKRPLEDSNEGPESSKEASEPAPKKRGRPRKNQDESSDTDEVIIVHLKPPTTATKETTNGKSVDGKPETVSEAESKEQPKEKADGVMETGTPSSEVTPDSHTQPSDADVASNERVDDKSTPSRSGRRKRSKPDRFVDRYAI